MNRAFSLSLRVLTALSVCILWTDVPAQAVSAKDVPEKTWKTWIDASTWSASMVQKMVDSLSPKSTNEKEKLVHEKEKEVRNTQHSLKTSKGMQKKAFEKTLAQDRIMLAILSNKHPKPESKSKASALPQWDKLVKNSAMAPVLIDVLIEDTLELSDAEKKARKVLKTKEVTDQKAQIKVEKDPIRRKSLEKQIARDSLELMILLGKYPKK